MSLSSGGKQKTSGTENCLVGDIEELLNLTRLKWLVWSSVKEVKVFIRMASDEV